MKSSSLFLMLLVLVFSMCAISYAATPTKKPVPTKKPTVKPTLIPKLPTKAPSTPTPTPYTGSFVGIEKTPTPSPKSSKPIPPPTPTPSPKPAGHYIKCSKFSNMSWNLREPYITYQELIQRYPDIKQGTGTGSYDAFLDALDERHCESLVNKTTFYCPADLKGYGASGSFTDYWEGFQYAFPQLKGESPYDYRNVFLIDPTDLTMNSFIFWKYDNFNAHCAPKIGRKTKNYTFAFDIQGSLGTQKMNSDGFKNAITAEIKKICNQIPGAAYSSVLASDGAIGSCVPDNTTDYYYYLRAKSGFSKPNFQLSDGVKMISNYFNANQKTFVPIKKGEWLVPDESNVLTINNWSYANQNFIVNNRSKYEIKGAVKPKFKTYILFVNFYTSDNSYYPYTGVGEVMRLKQIDFYTSAVCEGKSAINANCSNINDKYKFNGTGIKK